MQLPDDCNDKLQCTLFTGNVNTTLLFNCPWRDSANRSFINTKLVTCITSPRCKYFLYLEVEAKDVYSLILLLFIITSPSPVNVWNIEIYSSWLTIKPAYNLLCIGTKVMDGHKSCMIDDHTVLVCDYWETVEWNICARVRQGRGEITVYRGLSLHSTCTVCL